MPFPEIRLRRLRRKEPLRALVRETTLEPGDLIYPFFICPGKGVRSAISSMPGVFNLSVDEAVREAEEAARLGIGGLLLFGLPENKDEQATGAWDDDGIVQRRFALSSKAQRRKSWSSSPTSASANTPATATAVSSSKLGDGLRSRQRSITRTSGQAPRQPRPRRSRHRRPQRHDGRPRRRHPPGPRRRRQHARRPS